MELMKTDYLLLSLFITRYRPIAISKPISMNSNFTFKLRKPHKSFSKKRHLAVVEPTSLLTFGMDNSQYNGGIDNIR